MKKKILFITIVLFINVFGFSQSINYAYDASGNRVSRTIILPPVAPPSSDTNNTINNTKYFDSVNDMNFVIFPNPTQGMIVLEMKDDYNFQDSKIMVYSQTGQLIFENDKLNRITNINLENEKAGNYFLRIIIDGELREWKLIKI